MEDIKGVRTGCATRSEIDIDCTAARRPQLVKGFMQLFSVEQKRSQALEAHAAAFSTLKVPLVRRPRGCFSGSLSRAAQPPCQQLTFVPMQA